MVVEILGRHGQEVSLDRAAAILELIYELSWHSVALEIELAKKHIQQRQEEMSRLEQETKSKENSQPKPKGKRR